MGGGVESQGKEIVECRIIGSSTSSTSTSTSTTSTRMGIGSIHLIHAEPDLGTNGDMCMCVPHLHQRQPPSPPPSPPSSGVPSKRLPSLETGRRHCSRLVPKRRGSLDHPAQSCCTDPQWSQQSWCLQGHEANIIVFNLIQFNLI